ncbi:DUF4352 domain-containing protein [Actinomadura sp. 9N407]|uniref:DUF4352 domain-containing protein n=1 Tax=Actinomadura sp. 9N407 TaxID=3375154 RepID=UPI00378AA526
MYTPTPAPYGPRQGKQSNNKGCLYGFIGAATLFVMVGACGVIVGASGQTGSSTITTATSPTASPLTAAPGKTRTPKKKVTNGIGKPYRDGKFSFTVTRVKKGVKRVGGQYFGEEAQGQFVFVYVTVKNIGDDSRTFMSANQTLYDTGGRKFEADGEATFVMAEESKAFIEDINPGNSVKGILIFDVPKGVKLKSVKLHDSMFSGGVIVPLGNR